MQVFVVEMLRWGERELHSYVQGVYPTLDEAQAAAVEAEDDRGGKYEAEIAAFTLGQGRQGLDIIKRSDKNWWDPVPNERRLAVGDQVKNTDGNSGTVLEVSEDFRGLQSVLVTYGDDNDRWHSVENLEKV